MATKKQRARMAKRMQEAEEKPEVKKPSKKKK